MDHWSTFELLCRVCAPSTGSGLGKGAAASILGLGAQTQAAPGLGGGIKIPVGIPAPTGVAPSGISGSSGAASLLPAGFESRVHMFAGAATIALILLTIGFPRNLRNLEEQLEEQLAEEQLAEGQLAEGQLADEEAAADEDDEEVASIMESAAGSQGQSSHSSFGPCGIPDLGSVSLVPLQTLTPRPRDPIGTQAQKDDAPMPVFHQMLPHDVPSSTSLESVDWDRHSDTDESWKALQRWNELAVEARQEQRRKEYLRLNALDLLVDSRIMALAPQAPTPPIRSPSTRRISITPLALLASDADPLERPSSACALSAPMQTQAQSSNPGGPPASSPPEGLTPSVSSSRSSGWDIESVAVSGTSTNTDASDTPSDSQWDLL